MSSRDLRLKLVLDALDKASAPLKKITGASTHTGKALKQSREQLKKLQAQQRDVKSFHKTRLQLLKNNKALGVQNATLKESTASLADQQAQHVNLKGNLRAAEKEYRQLTKAMIEGKGETEEFRFELQKAQISLQAKQQAFERSTDSIKKYKGRIWQANNRIKKLNDSQSKGQKNLSAYRKRLDEAGIGTEKLARKARDLRHEEERTTKALKAQKAQLERINQLQKHRQAIATAGANVRSQAGSLALQGGAAAAAGGYFFKTQFLDKAAQFEDFRATLKTVEGSSDKARKSMNWVSDFAAKTPYELAQVTEAYVKMRSYGLEPTNGLLKTLGDTSAAMNKPILQSVEAIADAVTGENERLKEFGIKASTARGMITYTYSDADGNQKAMSADAHNRAQIQETLQAIWNAKFKGAMDERSRTWNGMMSNMGDQWTRFTTLVMDAGLFDWMKGKLGGFLDKVDAMAADGSLQALAKEWGTTLKAFATGTWAVISAVSAATTSIAGFVGGWDNLIYIMAALKLAPLISGIWTLGAALKPLAAAYLPAVLTALKGVALFFVTNPIGLAIAGIAAAAGLIYYHWDKVGPMLNGVWTEIKTAFSGGVVGVTSLLINWSPVGMIYNAVREGLALLGIQLPNKFTEFGSMMIDGLTSGIKAKLGALKETVVGAASEASNWFKDKLGIRSPSRVFISHGSDVMSGLEKGLGDNKNTLKPVMAVGKRLKQAGAGMALSAVAMNAPALDTRPPLQAGAAGGSNALHIGEIHVHAAPGMDEQALARMVAAEIAKLQMKQAAHQRSKLSDED